MLDHRVRPVDQGRDAVLAPEQPPLVSLMGRLEHKAQSGIVALALEAIKATSTAVKAHPPGLAKAHPVSGQVGARGQGLRGYGIEVVSYPGAVRVFGNRMQGVGREAVGVPQKREGCAALLLVRPGDGPCLLPPWVSPHPSQAARRLPQQRIIEAARRLETRTQTPALPGIGR